ncbi:Smr/MutS family protein [Pseudogemmobacter sonorensis]|uniref:Smr/MutS family protein n=1 Tax=Pseudogemmobacter sonorensis TaxID=2989681 RepID=UPI0036A1C61E
MARKRILRPDEAELWQAVARTARALPGRAAKGAPAAFDLPAPDAVTPNPAAARPLPLPPLANPPAFRIGQKATAKATAARPHDLAPPLKDMPLRMDMKTHARMTRGKIRPEARIDLHGMTLARAHPELIGFLMRAQAEGLRLVLVITGKGREMHDPVPRPMGALRHQVPHWLRLPPLSHIVLQLTEAHLKHGGSGAYYVYLRRF